MRIGMLLGLFGFNTLSHSLDDVVRLNHDSDGRGCVCDRKVTQYIGRPGPSRRRLGKGRELDYGLSSTNLADME